VLAGGAQRDTVEAFLAQPLVVEVRDEAGRLRPGVTVRFAADLVTPGPTDEPTARISSTSPDDYQPLTERATDATGRVAVRVRLGTVVGPATIAITVPVLDLSASTRLEVGPGAVARITVLPNDTAVYVGGSYALRVVREDRLGYPLPVPVSFTSDAPEIAEAGATVTGRGIGRTRVLVRVGDVAVPVHVSVVPRGTLAANYGRDAYVFELDGSGHHRFWWEPGTSGVRDVRWITGGGAVWMHADRMRVSAPTNHGPWLVGWPMWEEVMRTSRDGQWVFFTGLWFYNKYSWKRYANRIRVDGTDLQIIGDDGMLVPSPSPNGDRVVFTSHAETLGLRNIEAQESTMLWEQSGNWPEWSHGDSIAYVRGGAIRLMSSAGLGHRQVGDGTRYSGPLDWSPDDRFIVAHDTEGGRLEIIRVATGERIPLPFARGMYSPSWKP
jgi:hypothetical protein